MILKSIASMLVSFLIWLFITGFINSFIIFDNANQQIEMIEKNLEDSSLTRCEKTLDVERDSLSFLSTINSYIGILIGFLFGVICHIWICQTPYNKKQ